MAKKWVRVLSTLTYDVRGIQEIAYPGDWIQVGKQQARVWLAQGRVEIPRPDRRIVSVDYAHSGVLVRGGHPELSEFGDLTTKLAFVDGNLRLPFDFTVIWVPSLPVTPRAVESGLSRCRESRIEGWEVLAMLAGETTTAADVGSEDERDRTVQVVRDLRTPVYDPRLVWLRRTSATKRLVGLWAKEIAAGNDERHGFLRSLYRSAAVIQALPSNWQSLQVRWMPHGGFP